MGIPVLFARKALAIADVRMNQIDKIPNGDEEFMLDDAFFSFLESMCDLHEDTRSIPLRVGATMRCDEYGAFGYAFKTAVDLGGSYRRVERYGRVVTSIANFQLEAAGSHHYLAVIPSSQQRLGLRLTQELAVSAAMALSREVSKHDFIPIAVHLTLPEPKDPLPYQSHFRCPVHFQSDRDAIEVSEEHLLGKNHLGDVSIVNFFDQHLDKELQQLPEQNSFLQEVRAEVLAGLSEGLFTLTEMAERLHVSRRSLQRQLAESGLTYQQLITESRKELAEKLLRTSEMSIVEIAFLAGFSDQSTFTRAFKRWSGITPRTYRLTSRP